MSKTPIPLHLRRKVAEQAKHRCGYCLTPEHIIGVEMEVDHIIPEALEGKTEEANLWLACEKCNKHLVQARKLWVSVGWHPPQD